MVMRKQHKGYIVSFLALAVLLMGAFGANFVFAKGQSHTVAHGDPNVSARRVTAPAASAHTVDMQNVPAVTKTPTPLSGQPVVLPFLTGVSPAVYAQRKAAAAHNKNAPIAPFVYANPRSSSINTPTAQIKFQGLADSPTICPPSGCAPPDQALATSPNWVFQGVNTSFAVYNIAGTLQPGWPKTAVSFFGIPSPGACAPTGPFVSDPRAFYDINDGRFWATVLEVEGAFGENTTCPLVSRYWVAVSPVGNPNGVWNVYNFDMSLGSGFAADFTQIGYDRQAFYFSGDMFNTAGTAFQYAEVQAANKATMEAGGAVTPIAFTHFTSGSVETNTVQPVETDAHSYSGPNVEFLVNSFDFNFGGGNCSTGCSGIIVWAFNFATSTITGIVVSTSSYTLAPHADAPNCSLCIDTSDPSISGTPVYRNGLISFALETGAMNSTRIVPTIFWGQISPTVNDSGAITGGTVFQSGYFLHQGDAATSFGALMPDNDGDLFMVFELMGSSINPEVAYTARRVTFATGLFHDGGLILRKGDGTPPPPTPPNPTRWGDYEAASFDGYSTDKVWFSGEYATSTGDWSTFIGKDQFCITCN